MAGDCDCDRSEPTNCRMSPFTRSTHKYALTHTHIHISFFFFFKLKPNFFKKKNRKNDCSTRISRGEAETRENVKGTSSAAQLQVQCGEYLSFNITRYLCAWRAISLPSPTRPSPLFHALPRHLDIRFSQ